MPVMKDMLRAVCARLCGRDDLDCDALCQELQAHRNSASETTATNVLDRWLLQLQVPPHPSAATTNGATTNGAVADGSAHALGYADHTATTATDSLTAITEVTEPPTAPTVCVQPLQPSVQSTSVQSTPLQASSARPQQLHALGAAGSHAISVDQVAARRVAAEGQHALQASTSRGCVSGAAAAHHAGQSGLAGSEPAHARPAAVAGAGPVLRLQANGVAARPGAAPAKPDAQSAIMSALHKRRGAINEADEHNTHTIYDSQLG